MGFENVQQTQKTEEAIKKTEETPVKVQENNKTNEANTQKKEENGIFSSEKYEFYGFFENLEVKKPKKKKSPAKKEEKTETDDIQVEETVDRKDLRILKK